MSAINADGTGLLEIGPADVGSLAWSPDGAMIAAGPSDLVEPGLLYVMNADGSGLRVLGAGAAPFDWLPDGSQIVFSMAGPTIPGSRPPHQTSAIYVTNADGTGRRWLANGEFPDWSPVAGRSE